MVMWPGRDGGRAGRGEWGEWRKREKERAYLESSFAMLPSMLCAYCTPTDYQWACRWDGCPRESVWDGSVKSFGCVPNGDVGMKLSAYS